MTPEQTLQKAIEIAQNNGYKFFSTYARDTNDNILIEDQLYLLENYYWSICPLHDVIFDRSFREALVGNHKRISVDIYRFSDYMKDEGTYFLKVKEVDYHLMMCAKSDDRIGYLEQVLLSLER